MTRGCQRARAELAWRDDPIAAVRSESERFLAERGVRRRAFVLTFGCQQNEADSEKLAGLAEAMGYEMTEEPSEADLIVVNTCAIREHAEKKALSTVGQYKHIKESNPDLIIAVCGCMVTQEHRREEIKRRYPYVDIVFGTGDVASLPELICRRLAEKKRIFAVGAITRPMEEGVPVKRGSRYRAWVSVMYGCNNFCSYCIVPYVRGRERSRHPQAVYDEVRELVEAGYRDITLLGQNVNSYGKDLDEPCSFADLLTSLDGIEGDYVLRFMTSHPKDADHALIDAMAASRHIAHQFHLPLQSGSDDVLRRMNRHYDRERYLSIVSYLREKMPDVTISSDIIVGFPGETDRDFEDTLDVLRRVRFDMLFSFLYSPRKGTPAAEMEEQITDDVRRERFDRLLALQKEIGEERNQALLGVPLHVLCDGVSKNNPSLYSGRTDGNKIAFFEGEESDVGRFVTFVAERVDAFALYGKKTDDI